MAKHKWKIGGKGWWQCSNCGLIREKHYGMSYDYYMETLQVTRPFNRAPDCPPIGSKIVTLTKDNAEVFNKSC